MYVAVVHFSVVPLFYPNELFLVPGFFSRRKYFLFALHAAASLVGFSWLSQLLFNRYADFIFPGYYFVSTFTFTDFLLKPFSFERFMQAVGKAVAEKSPESQEKESFITIKSGKKRFRIPAREIVYLESAGDYVKIITPSKTYLANEPLKYFENILPSGDFIRIHRSYLVSIPYIGYIEGNCVFVAGHELPLGRQYKDSLRTRLHLDS